MEISLTTAWMAFHCCDVIFQLSAALHDPYVSIDLGVSV